MSLAPKFERVDVDEKNELRVSQLASTDVDVRVGTIFFRAGTYTLLVNFRATR